MVLISGQNNPDGGKSCWGSGFLPTVYQGVELRSAGDPVLFLTNAPGVTREARRDSLDVLRELNQRRFAETGDPEILTRIERLRARVPDADERAGAGGPVAGARRDARSSTAPSPARRRSRNNCLLARRLVERGVRFVQLYHRGWDHHGTGTGDDLVNEPAEAVPRGRPGRRPRS